MAAKKKAFNPEKGSIQPFLTEENWIEFYREHKKEAETAHAEYLKKQADRKRKIDGEEPLSEQKVQEMQIVQSSKQKQKGNSGLTQAELALLCYYEYEVSKDIKWKITGINQNEFAQREGWESRTSGTGLAQWFSDFMKAENRTGNPESIRKLNARLSRYENVIPKLSEKAKPKAEEELKVVKYLIEEHNKKEKGSSF